jgi:hypothetical protein
MRSLPVAAVAIGASVASIGCGGVSSAPSPQSVAEFRQLTLDVQSAAANYRTQAMGATSVSECQQIHDSYDTEVRPWVSAMNGQSAGMDDLMHGHSAGADADVRCVSTMMEAELARHDAVACTSSNLADDTAEVSRHVDLMTSYSTHLEDRCDEILSAIDGGSPSWEGMMSSCEAQMHDAATADSMMNGGSMGMMP